MPETATEHLVFTPTTAARFLARKRPGTRETSEDVMVRLLEATEPRLEMTNTAGGGTKEPANEAPTSP